MNGYGAYIDIARPSRDGNEWFVLNLGGGNITGAGSIVGLRGPDPGTNRWHKPRVLCITNVNDVALKDIDMHVEGTAAAVDPGMQIEAAGKVAVTGTINTSDIDPQGNDVRPLGVKGASISVNNVDTRALRTDESSDNGDITFVALAPGSGYSPDGPNAFANRLTISGAINTAGAGSNRGNVTLLGVHVEFGPQASLIMPPPATLTFRVGTYPNGVGAGAEDMFWDQSASGLTPAYDVQWSGEFEPRLKLERVGSDMSLSWNGLGFNLQETLDVTNPAGWSNIGNTSPVTRPATEGPKFYRLKSSP